MPIIKSSLKTAAGAAPTAEGTVLTADQLLEQLRAFRNQIPEFVQLPKTAVTRQIQRVARINLDFARAAFNAVGASGTVQDVIGNTPDELHQADDDMARWSAVEAELEALFRGVAAANLVRRQRIARVALQTFNLSRELVKEPEHADLLPHVERMKRLPKFGRGRARATTEPQTPAAPPTQPKPA